MKLRKRSNRLIKRTNASEVHERMALVALHLAGIFDACIYIGTLSLFTSELRSRLLFSDYFETFCI